MKPNPNEAADSKLIRELTNAVPRGDAAAFSRLYDLYSFRIYKYLLVLARGNEHDAREVCQSVLIKLAKSCKAFEDEPQFWAWLGTLAKNCFIDHCRAQKRLDRLVLLDELPNVAAPSHSAPVLVELLPEALAALSAKERELIQAAYVDERSLQEVADAAGETYKAVESRLARARQKVREHLLKLLRHENQS